MVIVNKSFEQMLEDIELERCTYYGFYDGGFYYPGRDGGFDYCKYLERKGFPLHAFELSIENVILHGKLPASIKVFEGRNGTLVRIRDSGKGFDYKGKTKKLRNNKIYFHNIGAGLKAFDETGHEVSFEGDGNIVNIMSVQYIL